MELFSMTIPPMADRSNTPGGSQRAEQGQTASSIAPVTDRGEVTIVTVKAPWYAFDFLLSGQFRKAIPVYQRVAGLQFKAFSSITTEDGKFFGGIYRWDSEKQARNWYTPTWFANVERKRGHKPTVDYYPVVTDTAFVAPTFDYSKESDGVTVFVHAISPALSQQCLTQQPGLLRTYLVRQKDDKEGAMLLFAAAEMATAFLRNQQVSHYDWFRTPVLLSNGR